MDDIALLIGRPELLTPLCLIVAAIILIRSRAASSNTATSQLGQLRNTVAPQPAYRQPSALPDPRSSYERIPALLTAAEREFFAVLCDATPPGFVVYPQVRLASLVQVKPAARRDKSHWWRIQAKCLS